MNIVQELLGLRNLEIKNIEDVVFKDKRTKFLHLSYCGEVPYACPKCGSALYKHGKRVIKVIDTPLNGYPAILSITLPRCRCRNEDAKHIWQPEIPEIDEKHQMTRRALLSITEHSMHTTFADVAEDYPLTTNTVKNIFVDFLKENRRNLKFKTPAFLGIDEIKIKHMGELTVITDLEHRTLFDILRGRNQKQLIAYFKELANREQILWVCSDMYRPIQKAITDTMPNARWVIDYFHVVMKANDALDSVSKNLQKDMDKQVRIQTKKGLAYTLKQRLKDISAEDAAKLRDIRQDNALAPLMVAFDLKEDFLNIYAENTVSKDNAITAFETWEKNIPKDALYDKFRELAATVHHFYEQIFNYWDCPIAISNGLTKCTNRLIYENNMKGRGYSFDVLRARTLYRNINLRNALENGLLDNTGPVIPLNGSVFDIDGAQNDENA